LEEGEGAEGPLRRAQWALKPYPGARRRAAVEPKF